MVVAGYCLIQVTPTYSVSARGRFSAGSRRIRAALCDGRSLSAVPGADPLAQGVSLLAMPTPEGVAGAGRAAVALCRMWTSDLGNIGHDLPRHADAVDDVVPSDVVGHQPEDWRQRVGSAAGPGVAQLQDGVELAS